MEIATNAGIAGAAAPAGARPVSALFADSDASQLNMIRLYGENQREVAVRGTATTGRQVLDLLQEGVCPEVLVLNSLLRDENIFDLLARIGGMTLPRHPVVMGTILKISPQQQDRLLTAGCDYLILKPYSLRYLFASVANHGQDTLAFTRRRIDRSLDWHLQSLCADYSCKGTEYIRSIEHILTQQNVTPSVTEAYQAVAEEYHLNCEGVVTAVRRAIRQIHLRQTEEYQKMYRYCGKTGNRELSNADFLFLLAQQIRQELRG